MKKLLITTVITVLCACAHICSAQTAKHPNFKDRVDFPKLIQFIIKNGKPLHDTVYNVTTFTFTWTRDHLLMFAVADTFEAREGKSISVGEEGTFMEKCFVIYEEGELWTVSQAQASAVISNDSTLADQYLASLTKEARRKRR